MLSPHDVTGLVLAGGQGRRMGGQDKGLVDFNGTALAQWALQRLRPQVSALLLSANRHLEQYAAWGVPVVQDGTDDFPGPLAGLLAGFRHCATPWLACVPCDAPAFPTDLVARLAGGLGGQPAAVAVTVTDRGEPEMQPVFCLVNVQCADSLQAFLLGGGHRMRDWLQGLAACPVAFDRPGDARAFLNLNTEAELRLAASR
ncbi:MAG: molybdenum cofactor guanylyltransferase [Ramlibacter sp.]|nr:molybdenum cofactor guanylyltransferase [Ramlibacter sp.]